MTEGGGILPPVAAAVKRWLHGVDEGSTEGSAPPLSRLGSGIAKGGDFRHRPCR